MNDPLGSLSEPARAPATSPAWGILDLHLDILLHRHARDVVPFPVNRLYRRRDPARSLADAGRWRRLPFLDRMNAASHCDLPRLRQGVHGGAVLGLHSRHLDPDRAWADYLAQMASLEALAAQPGFRRVRTWADWHAARAAGEIGLAPGVEGAHLLGGPGAPWRQRLDRMAEDGVVYVTLSHFFNNAAAPANQVMHCHRYAPSPAGFSLSRHGLDLLEALAQRGVGIDVAHLHATALGEVCAWAGERGLPVLCTHTALRFEPGCAASLCRGRETEPGDQRHPCHRNLRLADLAAIAATGGVTGVFFAMASLGRAPGQPHASRRVAQHLLAGRDALDRLGFRGVQHLAIGSDYDGFIDIPRDQRDCRDLGLVTGEMAALGCTAEEIEAVASGNALRVLREIAVWPRGDFHASSRQGPSRT